MSEFPINDGMTILPSTSKYKHYGNKTFTDSDPAKPHNCETLISISVVDLVMKFREFYLSVKEMKRGRNDLKQAASKQEEYQSIAQDLCLRNCNAQDLSLRSCNQIEIMDAKGENSLTLFPAKFLESRRAVTQQKRRRRRRRRRRRGKGKDMCGLLQDVLIEILMRLPAKSLLRFKCVSKQWSSLISSRYFYNRVFTTVARQKQPRLYMCLVDEEGQRALLSISSTSPDKTCYVVVDQDLSITGMGGFYLSVVGGLMCFSRRGKACIYNPSTKQLLTLPAIKSDIIAEQCEWKDTRYYVGHDPVNDQYKLLCTIGISSEFLRMIKSEHWVLVLEAGGSWRKLVPLENYHHHAPFPLGRSTSGSVVRYMAWLNNYNCAVVSFDMRSEEFTFIPVPRVFAVGEHVPAVTMKADLIEYGGKIAIFYHTYLKKDCSAALWVLEDFGNKEWSNQTLVLQPCQRHLVQDTKLIVRGTTQDGKVILAPLKMHSRFYILCYDLQSNDLTKVEIKGVPHLWLHKECYFDLNFMDETESFIYLET